MRPTATLTREDRARLDMAADWMVRLQGDELDEEQLAEWLAWYDEPANRLAFDEMQAVQEDVQAVDRSERAAFAGRFLRPVPTKKPVRSGKPTLFRAHPGLAAAAAVAMVSFLVTLGAWQGGWFAPEAVNAVYRTARADHREVRLPDGSVAKLGALSSVSINYTSEARYLVLEGEALFTVKPDTARPFLVQAGRVRVRAVGTQFNVRRAEDSTFVSVKEGVVEVTQEEPPAVSLADAGKPGSESRTVIRATAGEQIVAPKADAFLRVASIAPQSVATWQEGRLEFVDESLRTVVATVNRYAPREIVLTDPVALGELRFTGIVMEGRIDDWVRAIQEVFPLRATTAGRGAILLSPAGS